ERDSGSGRPSGSLPPDQRGCDPRLPDLRHERQHDAGPRLHQPVHDGVQASGRLLDRVSRVLRERSPRDVGPPDRRGTEMTARPGRPRGSGPPALKTFDRLAVANIGVAVAAFGVAAAMAIMQALSRANLDLPFRSAAMYYMSVTAHGTLMAIVFTTFFIMGFGYVVAQQSLGSALTMRRTAWSSFWVAVGGAPPAL